MSTATFVIWVSLNDEVGHLLVSVDNFDRLIDSFSHLLILDVVSDDVGRLELCQ